MNDPDDRLGTSGGTDPQDAVRAWRRLADGAVLLDGFHALKHAVRFQADIPVAVTTDRQAALALADDLAPDVREAVDGLLVEVPEVTLKALVPRPHPTSVAALAVRPSRAAHLETLARMPRSTPVVVLDNPATWATPGP